MKNGTAGTIKTIGWLTIIGGVIGSFIMASMFPIVTTSGIYSTYTHESYNWAYAIVGIVSSLISGIVFIGFAEIIELLQSNADNTKNIAELLDSKQQKLIAETKEVKHDDLPEL